MASSKEWWQKYQEALRAGNAAAAAEYFKQYLEAKKSEGGGSKPTLVSLGKGKSYPNAIPLENIPDELERNPEFFDLMKGIVK